jgi:hypothetical protein
VSDLGYVDLRPILARLADLDRDLVLVGGQAVNSFDIRPIVERFGEWGICKNGLYCLFTTYESPVARFDE